MEDEVVREQLLNLLRGGNAHMTFDQAVADFPAAHYNSKAANIDYSFWHLLEHIRIAQWDILEFTINPDHVSPEWPVGYWPAQDENAGPQDWRRTVEEIRKDMLAIQKLVKDPPFDLFAPIPHAPDYSIFREILVVSDHNAYHISEFAVLRQVEGLW